MGNKASSHQHPHPNYYPYGSFPDGRGPNFPMPNHHHSMNSLNRLRPADSGYMTSPGDSGERAKLRHSRMSLNEFVFDRPMHAPHPPMHPFMIPAGPPSDPKLLKKWHKKQKKLIKKIGMNNMHPHMMPPMFPLPPMPPGVRSMSTDNIHMHSPGNGYAELPAVNPQSKKKKKEKTDFRKSYNYDENGRTADPWPASARPPRSTVSSVQSNPFTTASLSEYRLRNSADDSSGIVTSVSSSQQPSPTTPAEQRQHQKCQKTRQPAPNPPASVDLPTSPLSSAYRDESRSIGTHYESRSLGRQQTEPAERFEEESLFDEPPVKVTPEALAILERNARMYSAVCKETVDGDLSNKKDHLQPKQRLQLDVDREMNPQKHVSNSAKKEDEPAYSVSTSSVTTSNNRGGEDIDFSWVNDMQNCLDREISQQRRTSSPECIPVCYFGMDAPVMECMPKGVNANAPTMKPSALPDEKQSELKQIHSNVRSKAAMFDSEAHKNERKLLEQRQAAQRYKSRSIPRLTDTHQDPYIPRPDYSQLSSSQRQISIDTRPPPPPYQHRFFGDSRREELATSHTLSPSARRIRRPDGSNHLSTAKLPDQIQPEVIQKGRVYDATEYYRQNARRNSESSWRASMAY